MNVFDMPFARVYDCLVKKAERKGRTRAEVDAVTGWLTGYDAGRLAEMETGGITYGAFLENAPAWNQRAGLITGKVCGVQVETIVDPLTRKMRQLDKLVDELARGRALEKVLR